MLKKRKCPGRDSNPHSRIWPGDFKSPVSANSTTWAFRMFRFVSQCFSLSSLKVGQVGAPLRRFDAGMNHCSSLCGDFIKSPQIKATVTLRGHITDAVSLLSYRPEVYQMLQDLPVRVFGPNYEKITCNVCKDWSR